MMKTRLSSTFRRLGRRGQSGQSLVIMALGFVALLAFVGIVTDVSLMFVRYSTLTRAVDSASIAAAGQVRRQVPTDAELVQAGCPGAEENPCQGAKNLAFARSFANVNVAARQFIEFYGLNPSQVKTDMCASVSRTVDVGGVPTRQAIPGLEEDFDQLCSDEQRKLIKVTAQVESPTVFLRLLGWPDILLEAWSISETAVLDVVMIMDVSESMLNQTTYQTWANAGYNKMYLPPAVNAAMSGKWAGNPNEFEMWYDLGSRARGSDLTYLTTTDANSPFYVRELNFPGSTTYVGPAQTTRKACQVRYHPAASGVNGDAAGWSQLMGWYSAAGAAWTGGSQWLGFTPTYNYYDCCNDPNGDGYFRDLLCQPFREARDATAQFLQRIDFLRGDRVAFVTFDRQAYLINVRNSETGEITHMIDSESLALNTLEESIGVRAEPSFYKPQEAGTERERVPWQGAADQMQTAHNYEVWNNCPFEDAVLPFPYSVVSSYDLATMTALGFAGAYRDWAVPNRLWDNFYPYDQPALGIIGWDAMKNPNSPSYDSRFTPYISYDRWTSCSGTNVGAALRTGSMALTDPDTRRVEGAVWVMVMLGDGAAGGSDPVFDGGLPTAPSRLDYPYADPPDRERVKYGGLGLCPTGRPSAPGEVVDMTETVPTFPFCSDEVPETRHFCFDPTRTLADGTLSYVDLENTPECRFEYDVDDYARDWADWIGLAEIPGYLPGGGVTQRSQQQLPTIFTIGFGLNFNGGTTQCRAGSVHPSDIGDCLGEELLRYIADVGDNFRIDSDFQQDLLDDNLANYSLDANEWGARGECEEDADPTAFNAGDSIYEIIKPSPAGQSCGNYYNAPGGAELEAVFDEIASRMFTRLTR